ncbi:MAG TPA: hypothetical protein VFX49_00050 [Chloroflexota bacterium]|nr:hypothetical protein [Chloroflexota bacterium]
MRVFVTQRWGRDGVRLVPKAQLEALRRDGYREATAAEVASWYRDRRLAPPAVVREQAQALPLRVPVAFGTAETDVGGDAA